MSDKFTICKTGDRDGPWYVEYPSGFDDHDGVLCATFDEAVDQVVEDINRQCIDCDRGAVVDTSTGWECTACGSGDTAVIHQ